VYGSEARLAGVGCHTLAFCGGSLPFLSFIILPLSMRLPFLGLALTFAATASAGLRACVSVRWQNCLHAGADAYQPSETRIGCEPLLAHVI